MTKGNSFLIFGGSDWWLHAKRTEQFVAEKLARHGSPVVYINSIGIGVPSLTQTGTWKRLLKKLASIRRMFKRTDDNIIVVSPFVVPLWSMKWAVMLNIVLLRMQIIVASLLAGVRNPIVISAIPTSNLIIDYIKHSLHVYFLKDNFSEYYEEMQFVNVVQNDHELRIKADCVICSSIGFYNELTQKRRHVYYVPHGVHESFLNVNGAPEPEQFRNIPEPRITYWGQLETQLNEDLVEALAKKRPDWNLVFIGPKTHEYPRIESIPNVHFLAPVPIDELGVIGKYSQVLSIPWKENGWSLYSCPIKLREYFTTGKPVVTIPIIEIQNLYDDITYRASTVQDWVQSIDLALNENDSGQSAKRHAIAAHYDNNAATNLFVQVVEETYLAHTCAESPESSDLLLKRI
jgi:hypothetical protein